MYQIVKCPCCGKEIAYNAVMCPQCGAPVGSENPTGTEPQASEKDWIATLLLCFFLGGFGIHSFYAGKTLIGVLQLITLGGCGIWALIDFILIVIGQYKDGNGRPIKHK